MKHEHIFQFDLRGIWISASGLFTIVFSMEFCLLNSLIEKAVYFAHVSYTQDHTDGLPEGSEGNSQSVASGAFCVDWLFMDLWSWPAILPSLRSFTQLILTKALSCAMYCTRNRGQALSPRRAHTLVWQRNKLMNLASDQVTVRKAS